MSLEPNSKVVRSETALNRQRKHNKTINNQKLQNELLKAIKRLSKR